jgi:hypothetical protein
MENVDQSKKLTQGHVGCGTRFHISHADDRDTARVSDAAAQSLPVLSEGFG